MSKVKMISPAVPNVPWQDKPEGHTGAPVWRYSENPIIGRNQMCIRDRNYAELTLGEDYTDITTTIKVLTNRTDLLEDGAAVPFQTYIDAFNACLLYTSSQLRHCRCFHMRPWTMP